MAMRSEPSLTSSIARSALRAAFFVGFTPFLSRAAVEEDAVQRGEKIFQARCASCHGRLGEGVEKKHPDPLAGEKSVPELARYIEKWMPEDEPGTCVGQDAEDVARYIHGAFYSPIAQARHRKARVERSRLTVRQYQNAVADLVGGFREAGGAGPSRRVL